MPLKVTGLGAPTRQLLKRTWASKGQTPTEAQTEGRLGPCCPQLDTVLGCWRHGRERGVSPLPFFSSLSHRKHICFSDISLKPAPTYNYFVCLWTPYFCSPPHLYTLESRDVSPARPRDAKNGDSWTEALGQHPHPHPMHPDLLPLQTALLPHTQLILNQ